jgi:putative restriction endonuclease
MFTSSALHQGEVYTRDSLRRLFNITDQTLYTGIFKPADHDSIWLFVTECKTGDMTDYRDLLKGDILHWDGQTSGRKDELIISHERSGLELLVFYRRSKHQHVGAGFTYEGRFRYVSHVGGAPTHFVLQKV